MKMMGSFLSRALIMIFGYAYPAYECFKAAEKSNSETEQLLYWCQYWNVVAVLTICERLGDNLISWLPMYSEAKLAFFIFLWHPKTRGTLYVYECFLRPFLKKHEAEIDNRLLELRVKGGEIAILYWEKAATYGYTKFFEIVQYVSSLSVSSGPHATQQEPKATNDELDVCEPISPQAAEETNSNSNQQHERSAKSEKMPKTQLPAVENGNTEMCQQETFHKESVETRHGRWRLFNSSK